jgi:LPXTG-motif cell wall-anchored protein
VNQTPFPSSRRRLRRLAVLATGALLGLGGVLAIAAPASAHIAKLTGDGGCASDTGWTANLTLTNTWAENAADVEWVKVYDADWKELADLQVKGIQAGTHLAKADTTQGGDDEVTGTVAVPAEFTTIKVKVKVVYDDGRVQTPDATVHPRKDCASPSPSPSPSVSSPAPSVSTPAPGTGGGGPQLPTTGAATGTAVGIAAVLLAVGAGLFFFFRRRRIRFTA